MIIIITTIVGLVLAWRGASFVKVEICLAQNSAKRKTFQIRNPSMWIFSTSCQPWEFLRVQVGVHFCLTFSHPELTKDHVLTSAYVKIFRTVTRNAVNKSVWRKKDCFWHPLNKHAMNIWLSSLRIRAHLNWRTGKHLHVLHVSELIPRARIPDTRILQLMQPW